MNLICADFINCKKQTIYVLWPPKFLVTDRLWPHRLYNIQKNLLDIRNYSSYYYRVVTDYKFCLCSNRVFSKYRVFVYVDALQYSRCIRKQHAISFTILHNEQFSMYLTILVTILHNLQFSTTNLFTSSLILHCNDTH